MIKFIAEEINIIPDTERKDLCGFEQDTLKCIKLDKNTIGEALLVRFQVLAFGGQGLDGASGGQGLLVKLVDLSVFAAKYFKIVSE